MNQSSERTPILRPEDLYTHRKSRDASRLRVYNQILEQIYHRIQTVSRLPTGSISQILYSIPDFIFGLPRIDLEDCVVYIVYQLRTSGFDVKYTYPNLLNINWSHHERNYLLEQSPILQAMVDSKETADKAVRTAEKKAAKVTKIMTNTVHAPNTSGQDVSNNGQSLQARRQKKENKRTLQEAYPSLAAIKTVLSAKDYVPPNSFMDVMEKPKTEISQEKTKVFMW